MGYSLGSRQRIQDGQGACCEFDGSAGAAAAQQNTALALVNFFWGAWGTLNLLLSLDDVRESMQNTGKGAPQFVKQRLVYFVLLL